MYLKEDIIVFTILPFFFSFVMSIYGIIAKKSFLNPRQWELYSYLFFQEFYITSFSI